MATFSGKPVDVETVDQRGVEAIETNLDVIFDNFELALPRVDDTEEGDLLYIDEDGELTRLEIGDTDEILTVASGLPTWAAAASGDWDATLEKLVDQDVTNSTTLVDDTILQFTTVASALYHIELIILYSATSADRDFKWAVTMSSGNLIGLLRQHQFASNDTNNFTTSVTTGTTSIAGVVAGTEASAAIRMMWIEADMRTASAATFKFQFAQNSAAASTVSTCRAGSILRYKRLA